MDALDLEWPLGVSPIDEALSKARLEPIGGYISCRYTSVAHYISTRPIF